MLLLPIGESQPSFDASEDLNSSLELVFPEAPVELFDTNINSTLKIYSPLVVDCWELGCWPCEKIETTLDQMANDFKGKIVFGKLCTDFNPVTTEKYEVSRTPTLLIFDNSILVYKHVGNYPKEKLEHIILTALHMR